MSVKGNLLNRVITKVQLTKLLTYQPVIFTFQNMMVIRISRYNAQNQMPMKNEYF
jgi:hypothetical protein